MASVDQFSRSSSVRGSSVRTLRTGDYLIEDYKNHRVQRCSKNTERRDLASQITRCARRWGRSITKAVSCGVARNERLAGQRHFQSPHSIVFSCLTWIGLFFGRRGGRAGIRPCQLDRPRGVKVDGDGSYVIVDNLNHRVQLCSSSVLGNCTTVAGTGTSGSGLRELYNPESVALDDAADYVIADRWNNRVVKCLLSSQGSDCVVMVSNLSDPCHVSVLPSGEYLVTRSNVYHCRGAWRSG